MCTGHGSTSSPRPDKVSIRYAKLNKPLARDVYRLRIGRYRVIYKILEKEGVILIGKVALRIERTYKGLEELF